MRQRNLAVRVGIFVVLVGGVIGWKFIQAGRDESDIKANFHEWVRSSEGYSADPEYCDRLFEECHAATFDSCYSMGGRRRAASFDDDRYVAALTVSMASRARLDGREELAAGLEEMRRRYEIAPGGD